MTTAPARLRGDAPDSGQTPQGESESLSARVRRGALWLLASTLLLRVISIATTAIIARILDPRDFGIFAVATIVYMIVSSIGESGVAVCIMRADLDLDILAPTMTAVSMASCTLLAGAMVIFARPIAAALGSPAAAGPVRVMALTLIIVGITNVPTAQLARDFKQKKLFWAEIISFLPSTALLLLLAKSGSGATAFAWSRVLGQFISGCVVLVSVSRFYLPGVARSAFSILFRYGVPVAVANFVNYILLNVDYALVGHLMGAAPLGIYVLAFNVASWPANLFGNVLSSVTNTAFSRVRNDPARLKDAIASTLRAVSLAVMPVCSLMIVLAGPIVLTLYGSRWAAAASVLSVLSLYGAISVICSLFASVLAGTGRAKSLLVIQLVWLGALIPAMSIGVHRNGIVGAAEAHIAVIIPIVLPIYLFTLRRVTGVSFAILVKAVWPAILTSLAMALAAWEVVSHLSHPLAQLAGGLAVGGLIFVVTAGPQVIALLTRGKPVGPRLERILRFYSIGRSKVADTVIAPSPDGNASASDGHHMAGPDVAASDVDFCPRCRGSVAGYFCRTCGYSLGIGGPFAAAPLVSPAQPIWNTGPFESLFAALPRSEPLSSPWIRSEPPSSSAAQPTWTTAPDPRSSSAPPTSPMPRIVPATWTVLVGPDRTYYDRMRAARRLNESPIAFPEHTIRRRVPLVGNRMRIGRRSLVRGVIPEIDLADQPADPGVSRLHAILIADPGGTWSLVDSDSANGTLVNDVKVPVGEMVELHDGDRINLGAWTVITMQRGWYPE
jgi:lipopolysaccharide exporter